MCSIISSIGDKINGVANGAQEIVQSGCNFAGRRVDYFRYDVLPDAIRGINNASLYAIKNYFFVLPAIALSQEHYSDAAVATLICGLGVVDWMIKDRDVREASSLILGVPLAISIAVRAGTVLTTASSFYAVGIIIQTLCLAKLILIAKGEHY